MRSDPLTLPGLTPAVLTALTVIAGIAVLGCGEGVPADLTSPNTDCFSVTVTPSSVTLDSVGGTAQLIAVTQLCSGMPFIWSSSDSSVATVNTSGLVIAVGNGISTITANVECLAATQPVVVSGTATVTVALPYEGRGYFASFNRDETMPNG